MAETLMIIVWFSCFKGKCSCIDSLFEIYSPKLFGFSMKYLKMRVRPKNLSRMYLWQVWEHRQTLKTEYSFKSYLFTLRLIRSEGTFNKKAISLRYLESIQNDPDQTINEIIRKTNMIYPATDQLHHRANATPASRNFYET